MIEEKSLDKEVVKLQLKTDDLNRLYGKLTEDIKLLVNTYAAISKRMDDIEHPSLEPISRKFFELRRMLGVTS